MKKALSAALTLIFILALLSTTGCSEESPPQNLQVPPGSTTQNDQNNQIASLIDTDSKNFDLASRRSEIAKTGDDDVLPWPGTELPPGFPVYPGGDVVMAEYDEDGDFFLYIINTDEGAYRAYTNALVSAGWDFEESIQNWDFALSSHYYILMVYEDGEVGLYVCDIGDMMSEYEPEILDWPTALLPEGFPKYPGGDVIDVDEELGIFINIMNTNKSTYDSYIETLRAAGWSIDGDSEYDTISATKGTTLVSLIYDEDGSVGMLVFDVGIDFGSNTWPDDLPFSVPVYPDGVVESAYAGTASLGTYIKIANTSRASYDRYLDMLIEAGGEFAAARDPDSNAVLMDGGNGIVSVHISDDGTTVDIHINLF